MPQPISVSAGTFGLATRVSDLTANPKAADLRLTARGDLGMADNTAKLVLTVTREPLLWEQLGRFESSAKALTEIERVDLLDSAVVTGEEFSLRIAKVWGMSAESPVPDSGSPSNCVFADGRWLVSHQTGSPSMLVSNENPDPASPGFAGWSLSTAAAAWSQLPVGQSGRVEGTPAYSPLLNRWVCATAYSYPLNVFNQSRYFGVSSTDGVNWSAIGDHTRPPRGAVVWCPAPWNIFVAIQRANLASHGYANSWYYSADGINWTEGGPAPLGYNRLCYANGVVVAAAAASTPLLYLNLSRIASEGAGTISWAASDSAVQQWAGLLATNGTRFVAGSTTGTNRIAYSDNGANWTGVNIGAVAVQALGYVGSRAGRGTFLGAYNVSGSLGLLSSSDGAAWSAVAMGGSGNIAPTPFGPIAGYQLGDKWFALAGVISASTGVSGFAGFSGLESAAGHLFAVVAGGTAIGTGVRDVAVSPEGVFVEVGHEATVFQRSADIISWSATNAVENRRWNNIARGGTRFIAITGVQGFGGRVTRSIDGITWDATITVTDVSWTGLATDGASIAIAVSPTSPFMLRSTNEGAAWGTAAGWSGGSVTGIKYMQGAFYAFQAGASGGIWRSMDGGVVWAKVLTAPILDVAHSGSLFCAVNNEASPSVFTSTDGISWTQSASAHGLTHIGGGGGQFIAYKLSTTQILRSTNGTSWAASATPSLATRVGVKILYNGGLFLVALRVGTSATLLYSAR